MTTAMIYAVAFSAIAMVVLAVARDVPIFHLLLPTDTDAGFWASVTLLPTAFVLSSPGASLFDVLLQAFGLTIALVFSGGARFGTCGSDGSKSLFQSLLVQTSTAPEHWLLPNLLTQTAAAR